MTTDTSYIKKIFAEKDLKNRITKAMELDENFPFDWKEMILEYFFSVLNTKSPVFFLWDDEDGIKACVNCNDWFGYAEAFFIEIEYNDIVHVWEAHIENEKWGIMKWATKKYGHQPIPPHVKIMKKDNAWDDELEALPVWNQHMIDRENQNNED